MKLWQVTALAVVAMVAAAVVVPGRPLYHAGWYNVTIAAATIVTLAGARRAFAQARGARLRAAIAAAAFGALLAGLAGVASGLLAPDDREIVGAPGERVRADDLGGVLTFPLVGTAASSGAAGPVLLERQNRAPVEIGSQARNVGSFVVRTVARHVVYVEARDEHGGHLTVTQPTGSAFLSPVLLMQQRQTIAGMELPFDSFAVPAAHRLVKAVLFSPQQAAALRGMAGIEIPAVLLAVDDEDDRPLPHAIALVPDGASVAVGGLQFHAVVLGYPAVEADAAPQFAATIAGALLVIAGLVGVPLAARPAQREDV